MKTRVRRGDCRHQEMGKTGGLACFGSGYHSAGAG